MTYLMNSEQEAIYLQREESIRRIVFDRRPDLEGDLDVDREIVEAAQLVDGVRLRTPEVEAGIILLRFRE